jgi:beta-glucosidase
MRPEQLIAVVVRPDSALHEVRRVERRPQRRRAAVNDVERVAYLHSHLQAAARAVRDGVSLAGYFAWSRLDNFEWGWGYQKRFGLVFVDFGTQRRMPRSSARFYAQLVADNAVPPQPA